MSLDPFHAIEAAGARMASLGRSHPDAEVSRYPGRTVLDVVKHTGQVHRRTSLVVAERLTDRPELPAVPASNVIEWFEEGLTEMVGLLSTTDSAIVCWGFGPQPSVGFWVTRMLIETEVHRWDVETGVGEPNPIETEIALKAIDEARFMAFGRVSAPDGMVDGPIANFVATDADRVWTLVQVGDSFDLIDTGEADATVRGPASDLFLAMVGRNHGPLDETGDSASLERWRTVVDLMADAPV